MTTLKDVAKKANVSACTVSRYLNSNIVIKKETEKRINQAIQELNYVPNVVAKSLRSQRTSNIAVILPNINHLYYSEITSGISEALSKQGYSLFIYELDNLKLNEEEILLQMRENMVAGIIFIGLFSDTSFKESIQKALDWELPVVYTNRCIPYSGFPLLYPDLNQAVKIGINYLNSKGYHNPAFLHRKMPEYILQSFTDQYCQTAKTNIPPAIIALEENTDIKKCLTGLVNNNIDSVLVHNEMTAVQLTKAITQANIRVPNDIAIISLGNSLISQISTPQLTCIDLQNRKLGINSANIILNQINHKEFQKIIKIDPIIIERESV